MDEPLLVLEIMIELALPGAGFLDDLIRTRGAHPLFVKEVRCGDDDPFLGGRTFLRFPTHRSPPFLDEEVHMFGANTVITDFSTNAHPVLVLRRRSGFDL